MSRLRGWPLAAAIAGAVVAIAVVVVVALPGSGDDDGPDEPKPAATLPALERAWSSELAPGSEPLAIDTLDSTPRGELTTWTAGDTLVLLGRRRVTAYDASTGEQRWTLGPPAGTQRICGASPAPNAAGLGGLILASARGCRVAALLDVGTGKLRWRRDLGKRWSHTANDADLEVGDRTVAVALPFEDFRLLDARTGRPVEAKPAPARPVRAIAGQGLLVLAPLGGNGDGDSVDVYDIDSRRLRSRTPAPDTTEVDGIVSADPLVLDMSVRGHRAYRHIDGRGRPGAYVGKTFDNEPQLAGVLGDTVVLSYDITNPLDRTARYYGFDLATGEQRWTTDPRQTFVLGRRGGDLLTASLGGAGIAGAVNEGIDVKDSTRFVLGQAPAADPNAQKLLGTVREKGSWGVEFTVGWTADLFLVQTDDAVTAYRLPQPGRTPLPVPRPQIDWADGDVRTEQAVDLCDAVRPSTLRGLGFRSSVALPPPSSCNWRETFEPEGSDRSLTVQTFALPPRKDAPAAESAKRSVTDLRHDETNHFRADTPYPGLGDQAWWDQDRRDREDRSRLLVREGNLIVLVDSVYGGYRPGPHPGGRELLRLQATAAEDVLAKAGG